MENDGSCLIDGRRIEGERGFEGVGSSGRGRMYMVVVLVIRIEEVEGNNLNWSEIEVIFDIDFLLRYSSL